MKDISRAKCEGTFDHSTVSWRMKKFRSACKNVDDLARSDKSKTVHSEISESIDMCEKKAQIRLKISTKCV